MGGHGSRGKSPEITGGRARSWKGLDCTPTSTWVMAAFSSALPCSAVMPPVGSASPSPHLSTCAWLLLRYLPGGGRVQGAQSSGTAAARVEVDGALAVKLR